ncbi:MAG: thioesterase family protein [Propionibacteriales bacterium]|nr:thioesterase family protein [Propionibacteriales bacterium]
MLGQADPWRFGDAVARINWLPHAGRAHRWRGCGPGRDTGAVTTFEYDDDTAVARQQDGTYRGEVTDRWGAIGGTVNGGYLLGLCTRALQHTLDRPDPLVVSAYFLRPGRLGPAAVRTDVVRTGRRVSTAQARLVQGDKEVLRVLAGFGDLSTHQGRTRVDSKPPELPVPDDCVDVTGGRSLPGLSIVDRLECRARSVPGWVQGSPSGDMTAEFWMQFRDGREIDVLAVPSLVDCAAPVVLEDGAMGSSTIELTVHVRARPRPGWLACRVSTSNVMDGLHEEDFDMWDSDGTLVAQSRQLAMVF